MASINATPGSAVGSTQFNPGTGAASSKQAPTSKKIGNNSGSIGNVSSGFEMKAASAKAEAAGVPLSEVPGEGRAWDAIKSGWNSFWGIVFFWTKKAQTPEIQLSNALSDLKVKERELIQGKVEVETAFNTATRTFDDAKAKFEADDKRATAFVQAGNPQAANAARAALASKAIFDAASARLEKLTASYKQSKANLDAVQKQIQKKEQQIAAAQTGLIIDRATEQANKASIGIQYDDNGADAALAEAAKVGDRAAALATVANENPEAQLAAASEDADLAAYLASKAPKKEEAK